MKNIERNIRYIDDPDTGVTVAIVGEKYGSTTFDALDIIEKLVTNNSRYLTVDFNFTNNRTDELLMKQTYKGVAKCHPDYDVYNEEIGRDLARDKCIAKYENARDKRLVTFLKDLWRLTEATEQYLVGRLLR